MTYNKLIAFYGNIIYKMFIILYRCHQMAQQCVFSYLKIQVKRRFYAFFLLFNKLRSADKHNCHFVMLKFKFLWKNMPLAEETLPRKINPLCQNHIKVTKKQIISNHSKQTFLNKFKFEGSQRFHPHREVKRASFLEKFSWKLAMNIISACQVGGEAYIGGSF